jgi:hypothetical protein
MRAVSDASKAAMLMLNFSLSALENAVTSRILCLGTLIVDAR